MRIIGPSFVLVLLASGCPSDPSFVESDVPDTSGTTVTDTTVTDTTVTDTTLVSDTTLGSDIDTSEGDVEARACPPPCGPAAACVDGHCVCVAPDCDGLVREVPIDEIALAIPILDGPVVAYVRYIRQADIAVSRWNSQAWTHEDGVALDGTVPLGITVDQANRPIVIGSNEADGAAQFIWKTERDDWALTTTFQLPCRHAELLFDRNLERAVMSCTKTETATFSLYALGEPGGFVAELPWLTVGKSPNPNITRFVRDPAGDFWVIYSEGKGEEFTLHVARFDGSRWSTEPLGSVVPPLGATLGPPLDLALDGLGRPHAIYIHDVAGTGLTLTHRIRTGIESWSKYDVALDTQLDGVSLIDLEPAPGGTVHLLLNRRDTLTWARIADQTVEAQASIVAADDILAADLASDPALAPWVAYAPGRLSLRLWRPAGL